MAAQPGNVMKVEISAGYNMVLWMVGIFTLGIGALAMMLTTGDWPKQLDDEGITLRNKKRVRWDEITEIHPVTVVNEHGGRITGRLDMVAGKTKIKIVPQSIDPGWQVMDYIRQKLGNDKIDVG